MYKTIIYQGQISGFPLFKFQTADIIEKIQKGSFYMNSLKVYRDRYQTSGDEEIGDPFEGKIYVNNAQLIIPEKSIIEPCNNQVFSTPNEDDFVLCMFGINPQIHKSFCFNEDQKKKWLEIYDTALIIKDQQEFFNRIKNKALEMNIDIIGDFVNYYDDSINDVTPFICSLLKGIRNSVFHKRKKYAYQQEYRFTMVNNKKSDNFEMNIGDISDISTILPLDKFLNVEIYPHE